MQNIYKLSLLPLLFNRFQADPEAVHGQLIKGLAWASASPVAPPYWAQPLRRWLQAGLSHFGQIETDQSQSDLVAGRLTQTVWGLKFVNPLGLAAGFDKDGIAARAWPLLGFGFSELGTVTFQAQAGNPPPRLFRLPADGAALNRMGFNNQGALRLAQHLQVTYPQQAYPIPIGINLGKSKVTPLEQAAADYASSFSTLYPLGNYFVINVSSPNTVGLRQLQAKEQLAPIFAQLQALNVDHKPLLVKISPDLAWADLDDILELVHQYQLAGIIATNTTIARTGLSSQHLPGTGERLEQAAGGISGVPLRSRSTEMIRYIYRHTQGQLPIIGVGGIFTATDAWEKITAGATLLQIYTGWLYEGPWMIKQILTGLLQKLDAAGLHGINAAVGIDSEPGSSKN